MDRRGNRGTLFDASKVRLSELEDITRSSREEVSTRGEFSDFPSSKYTCKALRKEARRFFPLEPPFDSEKTREEILNRNFTPRDARKNRILSSRGDSTIPDELARPHADENDDRNAQETAEEQRDADTKAMIEMYGKKGLLPRPTLDRPAGRCGKELMSHCVFIPL
jgi:hypothetical protein